MSKFERFDGNIVPFASEATGQNRTIFGDTIQSDDINDNLNEKFKLGWEIVGANDNPTRQDFNALSYTTSYLISYLYQQGVPAWNALQNYYIGSVVVGSDGKVYKSKTGDVNNPNVGNNPIDDEDRLNWVSYYETETELEVALNGLLSQSIAQQAQIQILNDALQPNELLAQINNADGDLEINNEDNGLILKDRGNGKRYRLYIENDNLGIEEV